MLAGTTFAVAQDEEKLALAALAMVSDEQHAWVLLRHHLDVDVVVVSFAGFSGASSSEAADDDLDRFLDFVNLAALLPPSVYDTINNPFNRTSFLTAKGTFALDAQGTLLRTIYMYVFVFSPPTRERVGIMLFPIDDQQIQA